MILMTVVSLVVGGLVLAYVAYPHRGQDVPLMPWLGAALRRVVTRLPRLSEDEEPLIRGR